MSVAGVAHSRFKRQWGEALGLGGAGCPTGFEIRKGQIHELVAGAGLRAFSVRSGAG